MRIANYELQVEKIEIFDVYGRIALEQNIETFGQKEVGISDLNSGVYFIRIITEKGTTIKKIVKL